MPGSDVTRSTEMLCERVESTRLFTCGVSTDHPENDLICQNGLTYGCTNILSLCPYSPRPVSLTGLWATL
jgi:hypothetical protein